MRSYHLQLAGPTGRVIRRDGSVPTPAAGEVVVRVGAASVNYRDLAILRGTYPLPAVDGVVALSDGAGEVVAAGEGVTRVAVGDRVAGTYSARWRDGPIDWRVGVHQLGCTLDGMLAEYARLDAESVVRVPGHLSDAEAATLPCAALTAWSALTAMPRPVLAGEAVLTIGSGGVALFAIQFARALGARVVALTGSPANAERLAALGAHDVVVAGRGASDWDATVRARAGGAGVDHVVETGGAGALAPAMRSLAPNGQLASVALYEPGDGAFDPAVWNVSPVTMRRVFVGSRAGFEAMNRAVAAHGIRPVIAETFAFADAERAYARAGARDQFGKVVIAM